jgi:class 3 adenylate cyclase
VGLKDSLAQEVKSIFSQQWTTSKTTSVPAPENLRLNSNDAKNLETATVLYADLDGSTNMVDQKVWQFSAEIYKCFLKCAAEVIRGEGGTITSYDGDRVMAIFVGDRKNTSAVKAALKINSAVKDIINPALKAQYPDADFYVMHVVGIDTSQLHTARTGVRGDNDLVWIGRSANYAAKLTNLPDKATWITKSVFDALADEAKYSSGTLMWEKRLWTSMNNMEIYCSTYKWRIS